MNHAYYQCLKLLVTKPGWGYLILMQVHITYYPYPRKRVPNVWQNKAASTYPLITETLIQNYDLMTKSIYETVAILDRLGGANDVHILPCEDSRWNHTAKWDARSLKLFRNGE